MIVYVSDKDEESIYGDESEYFDEIDSLYDQDDFVTFLIFDCCCFCFKFLNEIDT